MKTRLLALVILLAPLATIASDAPPVPSPAPLVEPTQRAIIALQAMHQQSRMLAILFGPTYPDVADYFDARADAIEAVYELLFGVKIPQVQPGVQS